LRPHKNKRYEVLTLKLRRSANYGVDRFFEYFVKKTKEKEKLEEKRNLKKSMKSYNSLDYYNSDNAIK